MSSRLGNRPSLIKRLNFSANVALYSGIGIISTLALLAIAAPLISHYDPTGQDLENTLLSPNIHLSCQASLLQRLSRVNPSGDPWDLYDFCGIFASFSGTSFLFCGKFQV